MTRLYYEIIKDIPDRLTDLDHQLLRSTGHELITLAARAAKVSVDTFVNKRSEVNVAVVPITSGAGVIPGFTEAVAAILHYIGLKTFITNQSDIAGLGEAFQGQADLVFAADDQRFLAFNLKSGKVSDNSIATAKGFVEALAAAVELTTQGNIIGQKVLVLGLGPVGSHSVKELLAKQAEVWVLDKQKEKMTAAVRQYPQVQLATSLQEAMQVIDYVLDATPASGFIDANLLRNTTIFASPGVPLSLTAEAEQQLGPRLIYDNLALGVATMAIDGIFS